MHSGAKSLENYEIREFRWAELVGSCFSLQSLGLGRDETFGKNLWPSCVQIWTFYDHDVVEFVGGRDDKRGRYRVVHVSVSLSFAR